MHFTQAFFLAALVAVAAVSLHAEESKAITPSVQKDSWATFWMPRHGQKVAAVKKLSKCDLLMVGDSITQAWEFTGKKVWEEFYGKRNAFNIGFSGDRTEQVLWRLQNGEVEGISPKLAVLMIGTNNTGHRMDKAEETAAGIKAILDEMGKRLPNTKVLLLAIFPCGAKPDDKQRLLNNAINKLIAPLADNQRIYFMDLSAKFLQPDGTISKEIMPDYLHPNEKGYRIWAEAMEPAIVKLME